MSSDAKIVGYCRACGKPLDETSMRTAQGTIFCEEHVPMEHTAQTAASAESPYASPYTTATPPPVPNRDVSPGLAFGLGMIPGVGAIYNGQYAKGLVHVIIIGLMISITGPRIAPMKEEPCVCVPWIKGCSPFIDRLPGNSPGGSDRTCGDTAYTRPAQSATPASSAADAAIPRSRDC